MEMARKLHLIETKQHEQETLIRLMAAAIGHTDQSAQSVRRRAGFTAD
jgi:hypothetical protein